jgi:glycosyltransferase involved in cell wall biosynthesis
MPVLTLIESPNHVCYRYRIEAFVPALAARGIAITAEPLQRGNFIRWRQFLSLRQTDVVILQRKVMSPSHVWMLRKCAKRLVFDFDDAVFQRDSFSRRPAKSVKRMTGFRSVIAASDVVLAGNSYLADRAAAYGVPAKIHVIPTCIDTSRYKLARHVRQGESVRMAWIGSSSTLQGLRQAESWLAAVGQRIPGIKLRLICDAKLEIPGIRVEPRPWSSTTECDDLAAADIGISWLPDDSFTRGKCGLKILQYMAAGLPVVTNPVGVHPEMVIPGETGFLLETPEEWAEAIAQLANDPALRQRMGQAGRRRVEQLYSVQRWSMPFAEIVSGLLSTRSRKAA